MTELISIGVPTTLVQNQIYATPGRLHMVYSSAAVSISDTVAFTINDALVGAETVGAMNSAPFIRCAGVGGAVVICKVL